MHYGHSYDGAFLHMLCLPMDFTLQILLSHSYIVTLTCAYCKIIAARLNMDFYKLQKEAIESYVLCFNFFFEKVRGCQHLGYCSC
jgi:hypothetical protein